MCSEIEFEIVNTIDQVPRHPWDTMVKDNPYMTWGWLKTVEETCIAPHDSYYILAMQQKQLVGGTVCSMTKRSSKVLNIDDMIFGRLKKIIHSFNISMTPLLDCSPLRGRGTHQNFLQRIFIPLWFRFHAFWFERKLSDRMRAHLMVME